MKKIFTIILLGCLSLPFLTGCWNNKPVEAKKEIKSGKNEKTEKNSQSKEENKPTNKVETFKNPDDAKEFQITLPKGWENTTQEDKKDNPDTDAVFYASNFKTSVSLAILIENKSDFTDINAFTTLGENTFAEDPTIKNKPVKFNDIEPINGQNSKLATYDTEKSGMNLVCSEYVIEGIDSYIRVSFWSLKSNYEKNKTGYNEILSSIKEVEK
ncbi:hypothetical protein [Floricoccus penangensis]|uniref:Lipoprotein n=1 Tax=Floricoccus penangensis TaxID=1859475 RepID=A0A9Q5JGT1_9LACT|nr:hypothetical protein [Floricoccus penangensis]OFI47188.1 hypothetical protein BG262_00775 [Floricoccus penangensis]URZ87356.1 hypothetical protein KIW23_09860 [Floricoccus penangensis]